MSNRTIIPRLKVTSIAILITCLILIFIEGLSSLSISVYNLLSYTPPPAISRYDESLGWTGVPEIHIPDMYGPGKYVKTNSLGFRNDAEAEAVSSSTRIRIICSGDSFTYGEGVANDHAWCNRMPELDNRLEMVNLAQPGYGIDQMYLRYMRDGVVLERTVHIFAFIAGDFSRMGAMDQHQYGKPVIKIENDALMADNIPVPRYRWSASRLISRADFRTVSLAERAITRLFTANRHNTDLVDRVGPVASRIFQEIQQQDIKNNVIPVFVFLPTERDIEREYSWHQWTVEVMERLGLNFIDLTPALRALPAGKAATFFIAPGRQAEGHYTEAGNKWVAETLYKELGNIPQVNATLSGEVHPARKGENNSAR